MAVDVYCGPGKRRSTTAPILSCDTEWLPVKLWGEYMKEVKLPWAKGPTSTV